MQVYIKLRIRDLGLTLCYVLNKLNGSSQLSVVIPGINIVKLKRSAFKPSVGLLSSQACVLYCSHRRLERVAPILEE